MRKLFAIASAMLLVLIASGGTCPAQGAKAEDDFKLCLKSLSFLLGDLKMDFFQSVDKTAELGIKYMEALPSHPLGGGLNGTMAFTMDEATREKVLAKCEQAGVKIVGYGVGHPKNEQECEQMFAFCKAMGIEYIVMEPEKSHMDLLEKLARRYKIAVAIHNHPQPTAPYRVPEQVIEVIQGRSPLIGACADTGHWERAGREPVECLKKLEGRIIMLHFKDLNEKANPKAHDVVWGAGVCDVPGMMAELRRQHFKGYFSIEYEDPASCLENLPKIVKAFNKFNAMSEEELRAESQRSRAK